MAVTCQRPDGNLLFPRRQGRMAAGHQESQANGPASAGWWNRARRERLTPAKCPPCAAGFVDLASPRSTTCIEFDPRVCCRRFHHVADSTQRARVALARLGTVTPSGVGPAAERRVIAGWPCEARIPSFNRRLAANVKYPRQDSNLKPSAPEADALFSQTPRYDKELRRTQSTEVPTVVPTSPGAVLEPVFQPDLARVVAVWDRLPVAIRAGILARVETAVPQRG